MSDAPKFEVQVLLHADELLVQTQVVGVDNGPSGWIKVPLPFKKLAGQLAAHDEDAVEYGRVLTGALFQSEVSRSFRRALGHGADRFRIILDPEDRRLAGVRWECLFNPIEGTALPIAQNAGFAFSRYTASALEFRPRPPLTTMNRAIIAIANPNGLEALGLPKINPVSPITEILSGWTIDDISGDQRPVSIDSISASNLEGCNLLYLCCHGAFLKNGPVVYLEKNGPTREVEYVPVQDFVEHLTHDGRFLPGCIFIGSCNSLSEDPSIGATELTNTLAGLLTRVGAHAVIAMQGEVGQQFVSQFARAFFTALSKHGLVDVAMNVARYELRHSPDWWRPALYMARRETSWPGIAAGSPLQSVEPLMRLIRRDEVCPIIGPGAATYIIGEREYLARTLANEVQFPLNDPYAADLPKVNRFLDLDSRENTQAAVAATIRQILRETFQFNYAELALPLNHLFRMARARSVDRGATDIYGMLAELQLSVYVTTEPWGLLEQALLERGHAPVVEICRWNDRIPASPAIWDGGTYIPKPECPLVFCLFGVWSEPSSLVLSDYDQMEFLAACASKPTIMPSELLAKLSESKHLYLGFDTEEREFQFLLEVFRAIYLQSHPIEDWHTVVQVDLGARANRVEAAERYLTESLSPRFVSIHWAALDEFLERLHSSRPSDSVFPE